MSASKLPVVIYATIIVAALLRIGAGAFPQFYMGLLELAGAAWIAAFATFLFEYAPMLLSPRVERSAPG